MISTVETAFPETETMRTAIRFINSTSSPIFLTGKAGSGKTTFLKSLAKRIHKQFLVVAPTGIAALNAGGVTVHSQFLFPFGMFLPDSLITEEFNVSGSFYTPNTLARKHPLNSARKQVLRSIDLLVIDEVSMLRADLLDAIDYRLKAARGNFRESFGGVQLLLIGDLFQLPPVVKREEEAQLKPLYKTPWFFESKALQQIGFVYIELDKIFRQRDDIFIDLLNNLRNNKATRADIDELNKHYLPSGEIQNLQEVITLTTHNYKADELNQKALRELSTPSYYFESLVEGDFPETMYPVLNRLELKQGAQIMFTKNDSEGKAYFNGKLATITSIDDDEIEVSMAETHVLYTLKREVWENKKYTINTKSQELEDEVIGSFEQYPIKLAWAITVHKSQGLTFDKAIIDVGQAFADGQVYVALSRLRSLNGLILRTPIEPNVISTDKQVVSFSEENNRPAELYQVMKTKQHDFIQQIIQKTFDFNALLKEIGYIRKNKSEAAEFDKATLPVLDQLHDILSSETENTSKFRRQLISLLQENQRTPLLERIQKGSLYYTGTLSEITKKLLRHLEEMKKQKRVKGYVTSLTDLDQLISKKREEVDKALYITQVILENGNHFDFTEIAEKRAAERNDILAEIYKEIGSTIPKGKKVKRAAGSKKSKSNEPSTYDITLDLLDKGLTIESIAKERSLTVGTIESHLSKAVTEKRISIFQFLSEESVEVIAKAIQGMAPEFNSKDVFIKLEGKFSYGSLRAVMSHLGVKSTKPKEEA